MGKWLPGVVWLLATLLVVGALFPEIHENDDRATRELKQVLRSWKQRDVPHQAPVFEDKSFEKTHIRSKRNAYVPNLDGGCQTPGYTGQHCEFPICDYAENAGPPEEGQKLTIDYGTFNNATVQMSFAIDTLIFGWELEIDTSLPIKPSFVVKDLAGKEYKPKDLSTPYGNKVVGYFSSLDVPAGTYVVSTTAENLESAVEMIITIRGDTQLQVKTGFIAGDANNGFPERFDEVKPTVNTGEPSLFAAKSYNLRQPGALTTFSVFYDHDQKLLTRPQPLRIRYGCEYEYFYETFYCKTPGSYLVKVEGYDFYGRTFTRVNPVFCEEHSVPTPTPTPALPPITECFNGATKIIEKDNSISCFCESMFTGRDCSTPICLHGGKVGRASPTGPKTCICTGDAPYGPHCERIKCTDPAGLGGSLTDPPYLVLVVRVRQQLSNVILQIAKQLKAIKQTMQFDPEYLQKIVLVSFNNSVQGSKLYNNVEEVIADLLTMAKSTDNSGSCQADVISAVTEVFDKYALTLKSPVYVFTDALPQDLQMLKRAYEYNAYFYSPLYFMLIDSPVLDNCPETDVNSEEYMAMQRLSVRSGGMVFGPVGNQDIGEFFQKHVYATFYRSQVVYENDLFICSNQLQQQTIAVDQNLDELIFIAQGENLTLTLLDPNGRQSAFHSTASYAQTTYLWSVKGPIAGQWSFHVNAQNPNSPCQYRAYAGVHKDRSAKDKEFKMIWGFTDTDTHDAPFRLPIFGEPLDLVVRVENYHILNPEYENAEVVVYANHQSGRELEFAANSMWRSRCTFEIKFPSFTCWHPDEDLYFNLYLRDRKGNTIQRSGHFFCAYRQPTHTPPTGCQNGGVSLNGTCLCTPLWEGKHCDVRKCLNGGTSREGVFCDCPPGHTGRSCEITSCIDQGTKPQHFFHNTDRSFVILLDMSTSAIAVLDQLKDHMAPVMRDLNLHHPHWIIDYTVIGYNSTWSGPLISTILYEEVVATVAKAADQAQKYPDPHCLVQMWQALDMAIEYSLPNSYISIFQTALPNDQDTRAIATAYDGVTVKSLRINAFVGFKTKDQAFCSGTHGNYDYLTELVGYTDGQFYPLNLLTFKHALPTLPGMFSQSLVDRHELDDCASAKHSFYIPVDSFTQTVQVTIMGNAANITAYKPNGQNVIMSEVVDDDDTGLFIYEIRKPCDDLWQPLGKQPYCALFATQNLTWQEAQEYCQDAGGFLVDAMYASKDAWLDMNSQKQDIWIGLNDRANNGKWVWDRGTLKPEPLQSRNNSYSNWAPGEPANDVNRRCGSREFGGTDQAMWHSRDCSERRLFVCQKHKYTDMHEPNKIDDEDLPAGKWRIDVQTKNVANKWGSSCYYEARVQSKIQVYVGYSLDEHSDKGEPFPLVGNPNNIILSHLSGSVVSARQPRLTYAMLTNWRNGSLSDGITYAPRANCEYEWYSQTFSCPPGDAFSALHTGEDEYGVAFQRYSEGHCRKASTFCGNGGVVYQGKCVCDEFWTGDKCEIPVCMNGGVLNSFTNQCKCKRGYTGDACQFPVCLPKVPYNFGNTGKTFALVVENTQANSDALKSLQTYLKHVVSAANPNGAWFINYMLITFTASGESRVSSYTDLAEFVTQFTSYTQNPDKSQQQCGYPIYGRIADIMNDKNFVPLNSVIYVITRGLPNDNKRTQEVFWQLIGQTRPQLFVNLIKDPNCKVNFNGVLEGGLSNAAYGLNGNFFYLPGSDIADHMAIYLPAVQGSSVLSTPTMMVNKCSQLSVPLQIDTDTTDVFISVYADKYSPISVTDTFGNAVKVSTALQTDSTSILTFSTKGSAGIFTFTINSSDPVCMVQVRSRGGPQVFAGFVTGNHASAIHKDTALSLPQPNVNNTLVVHSSIPARLTMVEMYGNSWTDNTEHIKFVQLSPRWDCSFEFYSEPFQCPAEAFLAFVHGTDHAGQSFRRETYFSCQGLTNTTVPTQPPITVPTTTPTVPTTTTPMTPKNIVVDVMLLIDASNDMSNATYESVLVDFIVNTFGYFNLQQNGLNFAIYAVDGNDGSSQDMRYALQPLNSPEVLKKKLTNLGLPKLGDVFQSGGQKYLNDTLYLITKKSPMASPLFTNVNNRVVIYFTSKASPTDAAIAKATAMRTSGMFGFLSVAYQGDGSNTAALQKFTGGAKCAMTAASPADLKTVSGDIQQMIWGAAQAQNSKYC